VVELEPELHYFCVSRQEYNSLIANGNIHVTREGK